MNFRGSLISLFSFLICIFTIVSCFIPDEAKPAHATVTVHNQSDYDITYLNLEGETLGLLNSGDEHNFNIEFYSQIRLSIEYRSKEKPFDIKNDENALFYNVLEFKKIREAEGIEINLITDDPDSLEKDIYYSPWLIRDGAVAHIYIKNEGYKLEVIEGGTYSVIDIEDIFPSVPRN